MLSSYDIDKMKTSKINPIGFHYTILLSQPSQIVAKNLPGIIHFDGETYPLRKDSQIDFAMEHVFQHFYSLSSRKPIIRWKCVTAGLTVVEDDISDSVKGLWFVWMGRCSHTEGVCTVEIICCSLLGAKSAYQPEIFSEFSAGRIFGYRDFSVAKNSERLFTLISGSFCRRTKTLFQKRNTHHWYIACIIHSLDNATK